MIKLVLEKYDEFREAQMYKSLLNWGYNFPLRYLSIFGLNILTFFIGLILLSFNIKINFYLGSGVYILLILIILDAFNEEIISVYDNYSVISKTEEKKLKYNVLLSIIVAFFSAALLIFFYYGPVLNKIYFDTLWLGGLSSFIIYVIRKIIVDTYYYEVRSLYNVSVLGYRMKNLLYKIKFFLHTFLGPLTFKIFYLMQLTLIGVFYIVIFPSIIAMFIYFFIYVFSWTFRYDYKGLWIIKKIENSFQAVLDFTTKVLNTSPEQLIFYINTIAILCSLVYLIADIYVFIMRGTRYKIELLFKRYTPEMEEGTLNPNLIPVSEYKRNSNSNSSTNVQNANLMIKEGIAIDLLITNKLSDLEICEILQITPFDLQKYKKLTGDRRV